MRLHAMETSGSGSRFPVDVRSLQRPPKQAERRGHASPQGVNGRAEPFRGTHTRNRHEPENRTRVKVVLGEAAAAAARVDQGTDMPFGLMNALSTRGTDQRVVVQRRDRRDTELASNRREIE